MMSGLKSIKRNIINGKNVRNFIKQVQESLAKGDDILSLEDYKKECGWQPPS